MKLQLPKLFDKPRLLVAFVVLGAIGLGFAARQAPAPAAQAVVETPLELAAVDLATVANSPLASTLVVSGSLAPIRQSLLTAEVEGRIDEVLVRAGEPVRAGQILARMNAHDLASRVAEQRANLAASRAQLDLAGKTQRRNEELLARKFISATTVDNSRGAVDANREAVNAREAQLALAQQSLVRAVIRAPLAGTVAERAVEPGQHVGMNARLFSLVDLSELEFAANVPVSEVGAIRVGQAVQFVVEGIAEPRAGRVERIAPTADPASRMIPVYIRVANPDLVLKGGMIVRGRIKVGERAAALVVSNQVLREDGGKPYVLALAGDRVERREVGIGLADDAGGMVEVTSGLAAGERVLLARVGGIAPGRRVVVAGKS